MEVYVGMVTYACQHVVAFHYMLLNILFLYHT